MLIIRFFLKNILILLIVSKSNAQIVETIYGSINNDEFTSIVEIQGGGFIVSGSTIPIGGFGGKDIYVIRLNSSYEVIWSKIYGGNYDDAAYVSLINYNGNILLGCSSSSHNNGSNLDIVIMEIDLLGNVLWSKSFITNNYDEIPRKIIRSPKGLTLCSISNFAGTTASPSMVVFETDSMCNNIFWQNKISSSDFAGDIPSSIISSNLGGFILVGATKTYATNYDQVIIRLTNSGIIQSHVAFGSLQNENTQDVIELPNNDLVLLGNFRSLSGSGLEMALISMKSDYTFNWIKTYGDKGSKDDRPHAFKKTLMGDYILAGFSYTFGTGDMDLMVLRTDNNGVLINASNYGGDGDDQPFDMVLSNDQAIIVGSSSSSSFGLTDCYMIRKPISNSNDVNDDCFNVNIFESNLTLATHAFTFIQQDPNLVIDTLSFSNKSVLLEHRNILYNKIIKGNIIGLMSVFNDTDIAKIELNLIDSSHEIVGVRLLDSSDLNSFSLSITSDNNLLIKGGGLLLAPAHHLMKYRNGFDAFQMENIITNKIGAPLQIEPSAFIMIAADVDISDKIRANDISLLQQVIVKKIPGFPQQLPPELEQDYLDWRFIDKRTVDHDQGFKKASSFPYYSSKGYCRDNVPDIPFFLSNQGSCDTGYVETYSAIMLGDLVNGGSGVSFNNFDDQSSTLTLDLDDIHDLGYGTYRVFLNHTLNAQDKFVSLDFALDYDETNISIANAKMTVEDKLANPQWLCNDYNGEEFLFTSYSVNGYPVTGSLMYIDIHKTSGLPTVEDLGQLHVFVNGTEVPSTIRVRSQIATGIDISKDVSNFVNLYPNPADERITISLPSAYAKDVHVEFLNTIGQSVLSFDQEQMATEIELDLSHLAAGMYNCLIQIQDKATIVKKVVVR